jgi:hypothetical protein
MSAIEPTLAPRISGVARVLDLHSFGDGPNPQLVSEPMSAHLSVIAVTNIKPPIAMNLLADPKPAFVNLNFGEEPFNTLYGSSGCQRVAPLLPPAVVPITPPAGQGDTITSTHRTESLHVITTGVSA